MIPRSATPFLVAHQQSALLKVKGGPVCSEKLRRALTGERKIQAEEGALNYWQGVKRIPVFPQFTLCEYSFANALVFFNPRNNCDRIDVKTKQNTITGNLPWVVIRLRPIRERRPEVGAEYIDLARNALLDHAGEDLRYVSGENFAGFGLGERREGERHVPPK